MTTTTDGTFHYTLTVTPELQLLVNDALVEAPGTGTDGDQLLEWGLESVSAFQVQSDTALTLVVRDERPGGLGDSAITLHPGQRIRFAVFADYARGQVSTTESGEPQQPIRPFPDDDPQWKHSTPVAARSSSASPPSVLSPALNEPETDLKSDDTAVDEPSVTLPPPMGHVGRPAEVIEYDRDRPSMPVEDAEEVKDPSKKTRRRLWMWGTIAVLLLALIAVLWWRASLTDVYAATCIDERTMTRQLVDAPCEEGEQNYYRWWYTPKGGTVAAVGQDVDPGQGSTVRPGGDSVIVTGFKAGGGVVGE